MCTGMHTCWLAFARWTLSLKNHLTVKISVGKKAIYALVSLRNCQEAFERGTNTVWMWVMLLKNKALLLKNFSNKHFYCFFTCLLPLFTVQCNATLSAMEDVVESPDPASSSSSFSPLECTYSITVYAGYGVEIQVMFIISYEATNINYFSNMQLRHISDVK